MKLYYEEKQSLYDLQAKATFTPLMAFLQEQPDCTLRQLTAKFPEKGFIKYLESCIQEGWIDRSDRRYRLALPVYGKAEYQQATENPIVKELLEQLKKLSSAEFANLCQLLGNHPPITPYLVTGDLSLGEFHHGGLKDELQIFSLSTTGNSCDLAGFFEANRHLAEPLLYEKLRTLIGDVDEEYYFQQVQWILSRVTKGRPGRESIFLASLKLTGLLTEEQKLTVPYLKSLTEKSVLVDKMTDLNHFEKHVLLGILCNDKYKGLFQWFYKEK